MFGPMGSRRPVQDDTELQKKISRILGSTTEPAEADIVAQVLRHKGKSKTAKPVNRAKFKPTPKSGRKPKS